MKTLENFRRFVKENDKILAALQNEACAVMQKSIGNGEAFERALEKCESIAEERAQYLHVASVLRAFDEYMQCSP